MADVVGVNLDQLPPRVLKLKLSSVLSKWLGESEQNLERFGAAFVAYRTTTPMLLPLGAWRPAESFDWVRALVRGGLGALACVPLALLLAVLVGHEFAAWL